MATAPSLFGATPESIQQARDDALNKEANAYAQLDPFQRASAGLYRGGSQLGGAIGRMLGGQDPEMQRASLMKQLASQADTSTPDGMLAYAKSLQANGLTQQAFDVSQQAQQMKATSATTRQAEATASIAETKLSRDAGFTKAFDALPPDATDKEKMAVAMQFGDQANVLKVIEMSSNKEAARAAAVSALEVNNEAKMERLRVSNASAEALKQQDTSNRLLIAQILAASRQSNLEKPLTAAQQLKQTKATAKSTFELRAQDDDFNSLIKEGNDIIGSKGFETVQGISGVIPSLPGSNAYKTDALITGFKSRVKKIGLDQARIGGSIGAMTEKEWPIVEQMVANISPLAGNVKDQIAAVIAKMEAMQINSRTLHADTYGEETLPKMKPRAPSISTGTPPAAAGWGKATVVK